MKEPYFDKEEFRMRLRVLRKLYGETQAQFARRVGISQQAWNHYECGYRLPIKSILVLANRLQDLSLDWLLLGKTSFMPIHQRNAITALEREERETRALKAPRRIRKRDVTSRGRRKQAAESASAPD